MLSLALAVVAVVGTLGMEASLDVATVPPAAPAIAPGLPDVPAWDPVDDDSGEGATLRPVVYGLDALLLLVGLANLLATLVLVTRERTRDLGMLKAVGLTPRQLVGSAVTSQALIASLAAIAGIPAGLGLFRLAIGLSGSSDEFAYPPAWTAPLIAIGLVLAVAAVTLPLARRGAMLRVADALRYE
jgi:putative ABC transport system permease protein